jgi:hypothetical protein
MIDTEHAEVRPIVLTDGRVVWVDADDENDDEAFREALENS